MEIKMTVDLIIEKFNRILQNLEEMTKDEKDDEKDRQDDELLRA